MRLPLSENTTGTFWTGLPNSSNTLAVIVDCREVVIRCGFAVATSRAGSVLPIAMVTFALLVPEPVESLPAPAVVAATGPPDIAVTLAVPERESATKLTRAWPSTVSPGLSMRPRSVKK